MSAHEDVRWAFFRQSLTPVGLRNLDGVMERLGEKIDGGRLDYRIPFDQRVRFLRELREGLMLCEDREEFEFWFQWESNTDPEGSPLILAPDWFYIDRYLPMYREAAAGLEHEE